MDLPDGLLALLTKASPCYLATMMPDGSPQLTLTWVDTDGGNILINTVQGFQKLRNIERDRRVALTVSDPGSPARYYEVRGDVTGISTEARPSTSRNWPSAISARLIPGTEAGTRSACC